MQKTNVIDSSQASICWDFDERGSVPAHFAVLSAVTQKKEKKGIDANIYLRLRNMNKDDCGEGEICMAGGCPVGVLLVPRKPGA